MADRLMEAKAKAMNAHVFTMMLHDSDTNLDAHSDLLPLSRTQRVDMSDGVATGASLDHALLPAHGTDAPPGDTNGELCGSWNNPTFSADGADKGATVNGDLLGGTQGQAACETSPRIAADTPEAKASARSRYYADCAPGGSAR